MTYQECVIVSAYTGYVMCEVSDIHKYIEEKLGRRVLIHELADDEFWDEIREAIRPEFLALCRQKEDK